LLDLTVSHSLAAASGIGPVTDEIVEHPLGRLRMRVEDPAHLRQLARTRVRVKRWNQNELIG
jgi:hypothetical protein